MVCLCKKFILAHLIIVMFLFGFLIKSREKDISSKGPERGNILNYDHRSSVPRVIPIAWSTSIIIIHSNLINTL